MDLDWRRTWVLTVCGEHQNDDRQDRGHRYSGTPPPLNRLAGHFRFRRTFAGYLSPATGTTESPGLRDRRRVLLLLNDDRVSMLLFVNYRNDKIKVLLYRGIWDDNFFFSFLLISDTISYVDHGFTVCAVTRTRSHGVRFAIPFTARDGVQTTTDDGQNRGRCRGAVGQASRPPPPPLPPLGRDRRSTTAIRRHTLAVAPVGLFFVPCHDDWKKFKFTSAKFLWSLTIQLFF